MKVRNNIALVCIGLFEVISELQKEIWDQLCATVFHCNGQKLGQFMLRHIKDWVLLFCVHCLNYLWGRYYHTINICSCINVGPWNAITLKWAPIENKHPMYIGTHFDYSNHIVYKHPYKNRNPTKKGTSYHVNRSGFAYPLVLCIGHILQKGFENRPTFEHIYNLCSCSM